LILSTAIQKKLTYHQGRFSDLSVLLQDKQLKCTEAPGPFVSNL